MTTRRQDLRLSSCRFIQLSIDGRDLLYPAVPLEVIQFEQEFRRPVKVIREIGYLFVEFV